MLSIKNSRQFPIEEEANKVKKVIQSCVVLVSRVWIIQQNHFHRNHAFEPSGG